MENNNTYTVYMHITPSNKKYIGITKQIPKKRWNSGSGYRHNKYFYSAIKKYGWNNIKHEILFEGLSKEEAKNKEIELIELYNLTDRRFGYNITKGGDGLHGMIISDETKRKMSLNHHDVSGTNNPASRSVVNMNNLIVYKTIRDANKSVGKNYRNSSISAVCNGKRNYAGKDENGNRISWKYLDDYLKENNISLDQAYNILTFA